MKSIRFKNFRRFSEFPEFKFGDITILVGGNNSGKSTLVKGLLLLVDNLREEQFETEFLSLWPLFSFDKNHIHNVNLGTYDRAHKCGAKGGIVLSANLENFQITYEVEAKDIAQANSSAAYINSISITDLVRQIKFVFTERSMKVSFLSIDNAEERNSTKISREISKIHKRLEEVDDDAMEEIIALNEQLDKLRNVQTMEDDAPEYSSKSGEAFFPYTNVLNLIALEDHNIPRYFIAKLVYNFAAYQEIQPDIAEVVDTFSLDECDELKLSRGRKEISASEEKRKEEIKANHLFLEDKVSTIREIASELDRCLYNYQAHNGVIYIQAHSIAQHVVYSTFDRNDYMAQLLHTFTCENIQEGSEASRFLTRWLKNFKIGVNYRINSVQGEGYTVEIETTDRVWRHLADLGMGSNQLVTLLIELATLISIKGNRQYPLIIVEEPEQNLHPAVQSKLADLFAELNQTRGFKFLIETHSEYLIRRTQVLLAKTVQEDRLTEEDLDEKNPFKVHYFPENGIPYDMEYQLNGRFANNFGHGFFDAATETALELDSLQPRERRRGRR